MHGLRAELREVPLAGNGVPVLLRLGPGAVAWQAWAGNLGIGAFLNVQYQKGSTPPIPMMLVPTLQTTGFSIAPGPDVFLAFDGNAVQAILVAVWYQHWER